MNIEQIKADREAGTQGPWSVESDGHYPVIRKNFREDHHVDVCGPVHGYMYSRDEDGEQRANARRIARVPDLEHFAIEAMELLGRCLSQMECDWDVIDHDRGIGDTSIEDDETIMAARAFLKKYTKPD